MFFFLCGREMTGGTGEFRLGVRVRPRHQSVSHYSFLAERFCRPE